MMYWSKSIIISWICSLIHQNLITEGESSSRDWRALRRRSWLNVLETLGERFTSRHCFQLNQWMESFLSWPWRSLKICLEENSWRTEAWGWIAFKERSLIQTSSLYIPWCVQLKYCFLWRWTWRIRKTSYSLCTLKRWIPHRLCMEGWILWRGRWREDYLVHW